MTRAGAGRNHQWSPPCNWNSIQLEENPLIPLPYRAAALITGFGTILNNPVNRIPRAPGGLCVPYDVNGT